MTKRHIYRVQADREDGWWIITVPELAGVFTHARRLDQVEALIRDAIALWLDKPADSFDVLIEPHVGKDDAIVREAIAARELLAEYTSVAASSTSTAVVLLHEHGLTVRDIGSMLDISHQRAAQILEKADHRS
jgi:predicted RNase H-like HicB family nuclease